MHCRLSEDRSRPDSVDQFAQNVEEELEEALGLVNEGVRAVGLDYPVPQEVLEALSDCFGGSIRFVFSPK